jgi:hypothetical protein
LIEFDSGTHDTETTRARNRAMQSKYNSVVRDYRREDELIWDIMEWFKEHGVWAVRTHIHMRAVWVCRPGIPDIVGCYEGRTFAMEVKRPGQEARESQVDELDALAEAGGVALAVHSLEEVRAFMQGFKAGIKRYRKTY